jgi:hypothetical protein
MENDSPVFDTSPKASISHDPYQQRLQHQKYHGDMISPPTSPEPSQDETELYSAPQKLSTPKKLQKSKSTSLLRQKIAEEDAPPLPSRRDTHTSSVHQELSRKRSIKRMLTPPPSADQANFPSELTDKALSYAAASRTSDAPAPLDTSPSRWSVQKKASLDAWPTANNMSLTLSHPAEDSTTPELSRASSTSSASSAGHSLLPAAPILRDPKPANYMSLRKQSTASFNSAIMNTPAAQELFQNAHPFAAAAAAAAAPHPFGSELAQVAEVAEHFGLGPAELEHEERKFMAQQGLAQYAAEDYAREIDDLLEMLFSPFTIFSEPESEPERDTTHDFEEPRMLHSAGPQPMPLWI